MRKLAATAALLGVLLALSAAGPAMAAVPRGHLLPDGTAVAPPSAPPAVKAMIEAGNRIRHRPYIWGGGHVQWASRGYDCSGSVSYVMHAAGLLESPLDSTGFMHWGGGGAGSWVRIYANQEHVFAVIAGLRWDTSMPTEGDGSGPGWSEEMRSTQGFRLRHPVGLLNPPFDEQLAAPRNTRDTRSGPGGGVGGSGGGSGSGTTGSQGGVAGTGGASESAPSGAQGGVGAR